jgi:hypothetical protein
MKRYDYLITKRERRYKQGKRLSEEEDEELRKIRPNVFTPILTMFELLHDTIKTNQETRKNMRLQSGGAATSDAATTAATATAAATAAAAIIKAQKKENPDSDSSLPDSSLSSSTTAEDDAEDDAEVKRLSELERSLLPLLTKIIVYIEEKKKDAKKEDGEEDEEEKYPDIGTTAKNSAILVIRRIKKWWNDLISGGTSDLSSKLNLKKAIPQLANNPGDMNKLNMTAEQLNKLAEEATDVIHKPLQKIERILSNDVRDIASSSVEGIMNALSLIPGIGTTLQLWRLLQNVIVIMSKSVTTMAGAKTEGVALKTGIMGIKDKLADPNAIANAAAGNVMSQAQGALGGALPGAPALSSPALPSPALPSPALPSPALSSPALPSPALPSPALPGAPASPGAGDAMKILSQGGGGSKPNHLRSIKKYKQEYKQSLREIKKTRKNILRIMKNMI